MTKRLYLGDSKAEFAREVHNRLLNGSNHVNAKLSLSDVFNVISACFETIISETAKGNKVNWAGFGKFEAKMRKGRQVPNPRNLKEMVLYKDMKVPKFKAGYRFKDALKEKEL